MQFFSRVQQLCSEKGVSITSVALELGFSRSTPTAWKKGNVPSADAIEKLADYFNVSADYLLGRTPYTRPTDDPDLVWGYVTPTGRELTPEEQEEAKKYIDMMVRAHDAEKKDK